METQKEHIKEFTAGVIFSAKIIAILEKNGIDFNSKNQIRSVSADLQDLLEAMPQFANYDNKLIEENVEDVKISKVRKPRKDKKKITTRTVMKRLPSKKQLKYWSSMKGRPSNRLKNADKKK